MRKRKHSSLQEAEANGWDQWCNTEAEEMDPEAPIPLCHNIVSTTQIQCSQSTDIDLQRLAQVFPCTTYDKKRFAAITIRLASPQCTCLLFGSGKVVITGSTCFHACIMAAHTISSMLRQAIPNQAFYVRTCSIQNIVAHVELPPGKQIDLAGLYARFCECATYQKSIFPGLVLRLPKFPIVLLIFSSARMVCTGGRSYDDIHCGFACIYKILKQHIITTAPQE